MLIVWRGVADGVALGRKVAAGELGGEVTNMSKVHDAVRWTTPKSK